jgi:glucose/arabinose dehydrogenase
VAGSNLRSLTRARLTWFVASLALLVLGVGSRVESGQQTVPFNNNIPVAPRGLTARPLPDTPVVFDTAEGQNIRVVVVTKALENPWSLAFLPDGSMLITERAGRLRVIRNDVLDPQPISGAPASRTVGISGEPGAIHGFMDLALHPQFATNHFVYLTYTKPIDEKRQTNAIARGRLEGHALTDVRDIFVADAGVGGASRIAFGRDGTLFMTTGGVAGNDAQDPNSQAGKVLRLKDDGSVPSDNPFVGRAGYKPEVYSLGHRNSLGLALHPGTGELWQHENGPNGGDKINIIKPGRNYGWPLVSYGRTYQGAWQSQRPWQEGFEQPIVYWMPSIAVSGMAFYTGDKFPKWKGDIFVGSLRTGEIPGTGHIERILLNEKMEELRRESLLGELRQRIRDVRQGPDGLLYLLTDEKVGALIRIEPAP